jgi:hypothetical protein
VSLAAIEMPMQVQELQQICVPVPAPPRSAL